MMAAVKGCRENRLRRPPRTKRESITNIPFFEKRDRLHWRRARARPRRTLLFEGLLIKPAISERRCFRYGRRPGPARLCGDGLDGLDSRFLF